MRKKVGKEVKGGVNEGRKGNQWKEEGGAEDEEREKLNRKNLHAVRKEECGGKSGKDFPKNRRQSAPKRGKTRKSGFRGAKNKRVSSKNRPESGSKLGKVGKTEILERKRGGGVEVKKWALLPILQCHEVAKWVQMKFSRIFFRRSLAGNAEMLYLCTRNREATLLQERVTL